MKKFLIAAGAATLAGALTASPASAAPTVLDFTGNACDAGACTTGNAIAQSYGDSAGVDVSYATFTFTGNPTALDARYWDVGYGDLVGVIWAGTNQTDFSGRITLTALPGYEISLLSFDIATYLNNSAESPVLIESLGGTGIFDDVVDTLSPGHNHITVNSAYFTDGIALNWGPDAFNVGLDNIAFDVRAIDGTGPIPEPATWAMLILGFGAAGSVLRRRRPVAA
ncbi:PEPxxWA-CTERM sorting domain-containing protein [uncultured Phenylobacterium sp.]|uniref:PEPxxWA-CTERM sorting domain-containing protein n=1 Tax=uncultured Phenylobacterium sp. TaxID=349273 RepID=UPI0025F02A14|nr:PEPxxWA-CTERM sorting domain-containing protein [uncultured Phenylobacterium sp.]